MKIEFTDVYPDTSTIPEDTIIIYKGMYPDFFTRNAIGIGDRDIEQELEMYFRKKIMDGHAIPENKNSTSNDLMENIIKLRSMNFSEEFILRVLECGDYVRESRGA